MRENSATASPSTPDVPFPAGATTLSDWSDWDGLYRLLWSDGQLVEGTSIQLQVCAPQLPDGSIDVDGAVAGDPATVMVDELRDGYACDRLTVTVQGARNLARALTEAADLADTWAGAR